MSEFGAPSSEVLDEISSNNGWPPFFFSSTADAGLPDGAALKLRLFSLIRSCRSDDDAGLPDSDTLK